jgi:hypothetical protein
MIRPSIILTLYVLYLNSPSLSHAAFNSQKGGMCGKIEVDCNAGGEGKGKMKINGQDKDVGCGAGKGGKDCKGDGLTATCEGKVGGEHNGPVVQGGVEIENCQGMGASGGGKVFHKGDTSKPSTCGCIAVDEDTLQILFGCAGSDLSIKGNGGGTGNAEPGSGEDKGGSTAAPGG